MKLKKPWATKRLDAPAKSIIVFMLEQHGAGWRPVVERHANCRGTDPHDGCTVLQRFTGPDGTREQAEVWLRSADVKTRIRGQA